jgi:hypothetical protein
MNRVAKGLLAGAAGTTLLDAATYVDMAVRARPASQVPEEDVQALAQRAGVSLGGDEEAAGARKSAGGALLGKLTGLGIGAAFGLVRPAVRGLPPALAAVLAGLGAMAATDAGSAALGTTDPRSWSPQDWAADLVPHLAYGAGVVITYDALDRA